MTRRTGIITLQAAVVGVLVVVVYLTILRPNDDGTVSSVNAPGAPSGVASQPPRHPEHRVRPRQPRRQIAQRPTRQSTVAGAPAPTGLAPPPPVTPTSTPVGVGPPGGESPSDDQYDDTLARLSAALR
jgi:hypothetical protein